MFKELFVRREAARRDAAKAQASQRPITELLDDFDTLYARLEHAQEAQGITDEVCRMVIMPGQKGQATYAAKSAAYDDLARAAEILFECPMTVEDKNPKGMSTAIRNRLNPLLKNGPAAQRILQAQEFLAATLEILTGTHCGLTTVDRLLVSGRAKA